MLSTIIIVINNKRFSYGERKEKEEGTLLAGNQHNPKRKKQKKSAVEKISRNVPDERTKTVREEDRGEEDARTSVKKNSKHANLEKTTTGRFFLVKIKIKCRII